MPLYNNLFHTTVQIHAVMGGSGPMWQHFNVAVTSYWHDASQRVSWQAELATVETVDLGLLVAAVTWQLQYSLHVALDFELCDSHTHIHIFWPFIQF
jgi:hypothetical protein